METDWPSSARASIADRRGSAKRAPRARSRSAWWNLQYGEASWACLRNPSNQLDLHARNRVGELDAERRAGGRVFRKELPVNFVHRVLLGLHVGEEDRHLQYIGERRSHAFQIGFVQFENTPGLLFNIAAAIANAG